MRRLWASHSERSNTFWLWIIRTIALRLGRRAARLLLYPITLFFLIVAREQRKASRIFLSRALQRRASLWDVARHIHTFAATLVDRVYLFTDRHDRLDLRMQDRDVVLDYLKAGQPAIILGSQLGSYVVLPGIGVLRLRLPLTMRLGRGPAHAPPRTMPLWPTSSKLTARAAATTCTASSNHGASPAP